MITNRGSVFVSSVIHKITDVPGITLRLATTKHEQTIGVLERTYATLKPLLKMSWREICKQWHKFLPIAILGYNTTYYRNIGCSPGRKFHRRILYDNLDHKLRLKLKTGLVPTTVFADELLRRTQVLYEKTKIILMQSCIRCKKHYDKKATA